MSCLLIFLHKVLTNSSEKLRKPEIGARSLIREHEVDNSHFVPRLVDTLPSSIETVSLRVGKRETEKDLSYHLLFSGMEVEKSTFLPRLSKMVIAADVLYQSVERELQRAGITMHGSLSQM